MCVSVCVSVFSLSSHSLQWLHSSQKVSNTCKCACARMRVCVCVPDLRRRVCRAVARATAALCTVQRPVWRRASVCPIPRCSSPVRWAPPCAPGDLPVPAVPTPPSLRPPQPDSVGRYPPAPDHFTPPLQHPKPQPTPLHDHLPCHWMGKDLTSPAPANQLPSAAKASSSSFFLTCPTIARLRLSKLTGEQNTGSCYLLRALLRQKNQPIGNLVVARFHCP